MSLFELLEIRESACLEAASWEEFLFVIWGFVLPTVSSLWDSSLSLGILEMSIW